MQRNNLVGRLCAVSLFAGGLMMGCGPDETTDPNNTGSRKFEHPDEDLRVSRGEDAGDGEGQHPDPPERVLPGHGFRCVESCYNKVTMVAEGGNFAVTSDLGTITGSAGVVTPGTCDRTTKSNTLTFKSKSTLIENVKGEGECFDVTFTYDGFVQEGRASLDADGTLLRLGASSLEPRRPRAIAAPTARWARRP